MVAELARRLVPGVAEATSLRGAGLTDVGRQRDVNEDRLHIDLARGIFMVVDGVGGQAAGGRAADIAVRMLRERLERQTGDLADRVREAITIANNEIFHEAQQRPEWRGMACVLTVAVVEHGRLVIGHVGDTRLYLLQGGQARKLTPDHSPVGEREDARELSEFEAMRHPRRNEVFRDVGSTVHHLADRDFVHVADVAFPADAALLLCSDGLTDLVPIDLIRRTVHAHRGQPDDVVAALVRAANDAGGKDNITVVYVENEQFSGAAVPPGDGARQHGGQRRSRGWLMPVVVTLALLVAAGWWAWREGWIRRDVITAAVAPAVQAGVVVVRPGESIAAAIAQAPPGSTVFVEPGEYRERLTLRDHVRVVSRVPREAILRLPPDATPQDAAVVAAGVVGAEVAGFRIVGDATSPLGVGVITREAGVRLIDLEISGASTAAVAFGAGNEVLLLGSAIHDNSGAAIVAGSSASPRLAHNVFARNATAAGMASFVFEAGATPTIAGNVFRGVAVQAFSALDDETRQSLTSANVFVDSRPETPGVRQPAAPPRSR